MTFGAELRLLGALENGSLRLTAPAGYDCAAMSGIIASALFVRPAMEPIAHSFWQAGQDQSHGADAIKYLASCLAAKRVDYRTRGAATSADNQGVFAKYPRPEGTPLIDRFLESVSGESLEHLEDCFWRYFNFLAFHPFADGNGRTVRVLLLNDIARLVSGKFVSLPIGAVIYAWQPIYIEAIRRLSTEPETAWPVFVRLMLEILDMSLLLADALLDGTLSQLEGYGRAQHAPMRQLQNEQPRDAA